MHQTPWTKKGSSLPSDRIRPTTQPTISRNPNLKGKGKQQQPPEPPKSKEVRRLESLLAALQGGSGNDKDPKGGCFCQAREHALSTYSPLCHGCGLILCTINLPQYCCPHCASPLVAVAVRNTLINKLESQISETIAKEIEEKERIIAEAKRAAGAFPTLTGPTGKLPVFSPPANTNQAHKVLSLNSKTKKVTVSSYSTTPVSSRPVSRAESEEEEPTRVPPPPTEVIFSKRRVNPSRPWENLRSSGMNYLPQSRLDDEGTAREPGKRKNRRNRGKGKENESGTTGMVAEGVAGVSGQT